jgi:hypothetical protein
MGGPPVQQGTLFADPKPEEAGVVCRACGAAVSRSSWATVDGLQLIRLDCSACGRFVRHLDPLNCLFMPAAGDVPAAARRLPAACQWLGMVRGADGVWLAVVLADDLARCWDSLLTCALEGDQLCTPVAYPKRSHHDSI